jgi:hypothetical protein
VDGITAEPLSPTFSFISSALVCDYPLHEVFPGAHRHIGYKAAKLDFRNLPFKSIPGRQRHGQKDTPDRSSRPE